MPFNSGEKRKKKNIVSEGRSKSALRRMSFIVTGFLRGGLRGQMLCERIVWDKWTAGWELNTPGTRLGEGGAWASGT